MPRKQKKAPPLSPILEVAENVQDFLSLVNLTEDKFKAYLATCSDVNVRFYNIFPILIAANQGYLSIVETLIARGADINVCSDGDDEGQTPLSAAVKNGHPAIVQRLLLEPNISLDLGGALLPLACKACIEVSSLNERDNFYSIIKILMEYPKINLYQEDSEKHTALMYAFKDKDAKLIKLLLDPKENAKGRNINIETPSSDKLTPLAYLTQIKNLSMVKILMKDGYHLDWDFLENFEDVKIFNHLVNKDYLLVVAAAAGNVAAVKALISLDAIDLNVKSIVGDYAGHTALSIAVERGHQEIVELLLAQPKIDLEKGEPLLFCAITPSLGGKKDSSKLIEILINKGINPYQEYGTDKKNVILQAIDGLLDELEFLTQLDHPIFDFDRMDSSGRLPVEYAIGKKDLESIKTLARAKRPADLNKKNSTGYTPLSFALKNDCINIANYLITKQGVDINLPSGMDGNTFFHQALLQRKIEFLKLLRRKDGTYLKDLNINSKNKAGVTPLQVALSANLPEEVKSLINAGANLNISNESSYLLKLLITHITDSEKVKEILALLIEKNAIKNEPGLIHLVAESRHCNILEILEEKKIVALSEELNRKDDQDRTPLNCAINANSLLMIQYLLAKGAKVETQDLDVSVENRIIFLALLPYWAPTTNKNELIDFFKCFIIAGNITVLEALIKKEPSLVIDNPVFLMIAIFNKQIEVIEFLLKNGADANAKTSLTKDELSLTSDQIKKLSHLEKDENGSWKISAKEFVLSLFQDDEAIKNMFGITKQEANQFVLLSQQKNSQVTTSPKSDKKTGEDVLAKLNAAGIVLTTKTEKPPVGEFSGEMAKLSLLKKELEKNNKWGGRFVKLSGPDNRALTVTFSSKTFLANPFSGGSDSQLKALYDLDFSAIVPKPKPPVKAKKTAEPAKPAVTESEKPAKSIAPKLSPEDEESWKNGLRSALCDIENLSISYQLEDRKYVFRAVIKPGYHQFTNALGKQVILELTIEKLKQLLNRLNNQLTKHPEFASVDGQVVGEEIYLTVNPKEKISDPHGKDGTFADQFQQRITQARTSILRDLGLEEKQLPPVQDKKESSTPEETKKVKLKEVTGLHVQDFLNQITSSNLFGPSLTLTASKKKNCFTIKIDTSLDPRGEQLDILCEILLADCSGETIGELDGNTSHFIRRGEKDNLKTIILTFDENPTSSSHFAVLEKKIKSMQEAYTKALTEKKSKESSPSLPKEGGNSQLKPQTFFAPKEITPTDQKLDLNLKDFNVIDLREYLNFLTTCPNPALETNPTKKKALFALYFNAAIRSCLFLSESALFTAFTDEKKSYKNYFGNARTKLRHDFEVIKADWGNYYPKLDAFFKALAASMKVDALERCTSVLDYFSRNPDVTVHLGKFLGVQISIEEDKTKDTATTEAAPTEFAAREALKRDIRDIMGLGEKVLSWAQKQLAALMLCSLIGEAQGEEFKKLLALNPDEKRKPSACGKIYGEFGHEIKERDSAMVERLAKLIFEGKNLKRFVTQSAVNDVVVTTPTQNVSAGQKKVTSG